MNNDRSPDREDSWSGGAFILWNVAGFLFWVVLGLEFIHWLGWV